MKNFYKHILFTAAACSLTLAGLAMDKPVLQDQETGETKSPAPAKPNSASFFPNIDISGGTPFGADKKPFPNDLEQLIASYVDGAITPAIIEEFDKMRDGEDKKVAAEFIKNQSTLDLSNSKLDEKTLLEYLDRFGKNLRILDLSSDTQITNNGLQHLKKLTNLQTLNLWNTHITNDGLQHLANLTNLQNLNLWATKITNDGLQHLAMLTNLQNLCLGFTRITDQGLLYLENLTRLQNLNLVYTQITEQGIARLQAALPNCKIARLGRARVHPRQT